MNQFVNQFVQRYKFFSVLKGMNNAHFVDVLFVIASLFLLMSTTYSSQIEGVVVCNKTHCDFVPTPPEKIPSDEALVYTSSASGNRFTLTRIKRRAAGFIEPELGLN